MGADDLAKNRGAVIFKLACALLAYTHARVLDVFNHKNMWLPLSDRSLARTAGIFIDAYFDKFIASSRVAAVCVPLRVAMRGLCLKKFRGYVGIKGKDPANAP